jgi:hypothetical protein
MTPVPTQPVHVHQTQAILCYLPHKAQYTTNGLMLTSARTDPLRPQSDWLTLMLTVPAACDCRVCRTTLQLANISAAYIGLQAKQQLVGSGLTRKEAEVPAACDVA